MADDRDIREVRLEAADEEAEWIRRTQRGDRAAFGLLVERYQRRIFALVFRLVRRRDEVEDLAQDIFVKAFQGIATYSFQSSFLAWLSRIAVNHCYDFLRRQAMARVRYFWQMTQEGQRALEARLEGLNVDALTAEEKLALGDLVDKLMSRASAEDRMILALKELDGRSIEEIAQLLSLKESTVKVRLHRARKRMLEDWKRWQRSR